MKHRALYYIGSGLVTVGIGLMMTAMYRQGREDVEQETVWTEADKSVIGEPTEPRAS